MRNESEIARWYAGRIDPPTVIGIASSVARIIRAGEVSPTDKLPQVRVLASMLQVSPSTVSSAWTLLRRRGLVTGVGKGGVRVATGAADQPGFLHLPEGAVADLDLRFLYPDKDLLPDLGHALQHAARLPGLDEYYWHSVLPELREAIMPTWPYPAEAFAAVNGISDGASSTLRSLSVPGDRIAIETPTQPPLLRIILDHGLLPVEVATDEHGPDPQSLAQALKTQPIAFAYQPRGQVPTGSVLTTHRARQLAEILTPRETVTIVEYDDLNALSTVDAVSLGSHLPDRTVLLRSYEKAYGPDLRLAVVAAPQHIIENIHGRTLLSQQWVSRILQSALAWLINDPSTTQQVHYAAATYADRRNRVADSLERRGIRTHARDGLCLWIPVISEEAAIHYLAVNGVLAHPGDAATSKPNPAHIRIATSRISTNIDRLTRMLATASTIH